MREIKVAMFRRLGALAESVGLSLAFWEDGLIDSFTDEPFVKEEVFPPGVTVYTYVWFSKLDGRSDSRPYNLANSGYKVKVYSVPLLFMILVFEWLNFLCSIKGCC